MANNNGWTSLFSVWLFVFVCLASSERLIPGIYIFGDSLADVGTNNYLPNCTARADMLYHGIDSPRSKPTGRFSNGYNTVDYIAQFLGYTESPPPFLSLLDKNKQLPDKRVPNTGVNFASGGSGILDDTGKQWGTVISMKKQVQQFKNVRNEISKVFGAGELANISKSLFIITIGSNDIFEFFSANNMNMSTEQGQEHVSRLISDYEIHIRKLFKLGARKFGVIGVSLIGCCPVHRRLSETGGCLDAMNVYAKMFYASLRFLLQRLSLQLRDMRYALGDTYRMTQIIINAPHPFGLMEVRKACCGKGKLNAKSRCEPSSNLCDGRKTYLFWDQYHPTQAASGSLAIYLFGGAPVLVTPMSFGQLALVA